MPEHVHVVGLAGVGMSALAQHWALSGRYRVTGSDRHFDRGGGAEIRAPLEALGIRVVPQDGSGVAADTAFLATSTAIEAEIPDLVRATKLKVPVRHRSECLAEIASGHRTAVVTGTSGKSTVTAMLYEILAATIGASVITGGPVNSLRARGLLGNVGRAETDLLVIEGDESDGSLVRYRSPHLAVMLNLEKDHKEMAELEEIFGTFLARCEDVVIAADPPNLTRWREAAFYPAGARVTGFGFEAGEVRARDIELLPDRGRMTVDGVRLEVPLPGRYNLENALAATAAARELGVPLADAAAALRSFSGVHRRFEVTGSRGGVEVVDDFAHNPMKVGAALSAAQLRAERVLAVFQPHGFAPLRLFREELVEVLARTLRPGDRLWLPDVYYAGGSVVKDVSSADVTGPVATAGRQARYVPDWADLTAEVAATARPGDLVLVMGARDPDLPARARALLAALP